MYLVIDVGGTYTKYGYYDKTGHCLLKDKYKTITTNIEDFYNKMTSLVNQNTDGIAISMPGLLDSKTGIVHAITLLPFPFIIPFEIAYFIAFVAKADISSLSLKLSRFTFFTSVSYPIKFAYL